MKFEPQRQECERFLEALAPISNSNFTFQCIDDNKQRGDKTLLRVMRGSLENRFDVLAALNRRGAGIFFAVNELRPGPRRTANVIRVRAAFVDLDGCPLSRVLPHGPKIVVESSPGRFHAYWPVEGMPLNEFSRIQRGLAAACGGDMSVSDLPRVMRLPGFYWRKVTKDGERFPPFRSRIFHIEGGDQW